MAQQPKAVRELSRAVAKAFAGAGLVTEDVLTGPINLTDLPWQCPPLVSEETLDGVPLTDYLDYPVRVEASNVLKFWRQGLTGLLISPLTVATTTGWRQAKFLLRGISDGERALRFCVPEDFPAHNEYSGHVFTLECTHLLMTSVPVQKMVIDETSYWVKTEAGECGIRNGVIIDGGEWDADMSDMLSSLLTSPRGMVDNSCQYDLLAKSRSTLQENFEIFPEFEALDMALQAIHKLQQGMFCSELLAELRQAMPNTIDTKRRLNVIDEALDVMFGWAVNDRVRVLTLYELLVPEVMTSTVFSRSIHSLSRPPPAIMAQATLDKIGKFIRELRDETFKQLSPLDKPKYQRD